MVYQVFRSGSAGVKAAGKRTQLPDAIQLALKNIHEFPAMNVWIEESQSGEKFTKSRISEIARNSPA